MSKGKGGRPSGYSDAIAQTICDRLSDGESLRSICSGESLPSRSMVHRWLRENDKFRDQYMRAREAQADTLADEMLDIADEATNDWMVRNNPDNPGWVENGEAIRRSQLRIETRKWIAGKLRPKVYGDKITADHKHSGELTVHTKDQIDAIVAAGLRADT